MGLQLLKAKTAAVSLAISGLVLSSCGIANAPDSDVFASEVTVFRSPTCGCCALWIKHMEAAGFRVKDEVTEDMAAIKQQYGVSESLASCHTTVAAGYVIEGHIPAPDVERLLSEKPDVVGIAVPGMPIGSPGMESGNYVEPYTVFSFDEKGATSSFAEHL